MIKYVLFILLIFSLNSCDEKRITQNQTELFTGELALIKVDEVFERTDTVEFTIIGSSYTLNHFTNESNLCSSYGTQSGFGTNKLILVSNTSLPPHPNCDETRIPKGEI